MPEKNRHSYLDKDDLAEIVYSDFEYVANEKRSQIR